MARLHGLRDCRRHHSLHILLKTAFALRNRKHRLKEQRAQGYGMSRARRKPIMLCLLLTLLGN